MLAVILAGVGCLLVFGGWRATRQARVVTVVADSTTITMPARHTGERSAASLKLTNSGSTPYRVVGADVGGCNFQGCVQVVDQLPVTIPAYSSNVIHLEWVAGNPGELRRTIILFTDCPGKFEIPVQIAGHVLDAE
jgi:hypothetical protein